jgi:hypothetical protein
LREEHRLRVSENRVLRRIHGPKREEDGSQRKWHNDELHGLYASPNTVKMIKSKRKRQDIWNVRGRGDMFTGFLLGGQKGRDYW